MSSEEKLIVSKAKGKTVEERKIETTQKVMLKVDAFKEALHNCNKDKYFPLPKSVTGFSEWLGFDGKLEEVSAATINSRSDLLQEIRPLLSARKTKQVSNVLGDVQSLIKQQQKQIEALAGENHKLNMELEFAKRELSLFNKKHSQLEERLKRKNKTALILELGSKK